jgi:hypothetical protein
MLLRRDLERAVGHLSEEGLAGLTQHHYEKHSGFGCRHGSHYIEYQFQRRSGSQLKADLMAEEEHRRGLRTKPYYSHTILFGPGRREIHSSEWRKPSEVSLRLRMVLSHPASGHAPALMHQYYFGRDS